MIVELYSNSGECLYEYVSHVFKYLANYLWLTNTLACIPDKLDMVRTLFKIQKSFENVSVVFSKSTRSLTRASFLTYFFSCLYEDDSVYNSETTMLLITDGVSSL